MAQYAISTLKLTCLLIFIKLIDCKNLILRKKCDKKWKEQNSVKLGNRRHTFLEHFQAHYGYITRRYKVCIHIKQI